MNKQCTDCEFIDDPDVCIDCIYSDDYDNEIEDYDRITDNG